MSDSREEGMHPGWWTLIFVVATIGAIVLTATLFSGSLRSYARVTMVSDRAGLVMDRGAKVMMRGVQKHGASTLTTQFTGVFRDDPAEQARFLTMVHGLR